MIVKMKFITLTGPKRDIDRVTNDYLSKYEIQLENALSELKTVDNLQPFTDTNPYKSLWNGSIKPQYSGSKRSTGA